MLSDLNQLVAGAHERKYSNTPNIQIRTVGRYLPFDKFQKGDRCHHDIAILKTNAPFQLNQFVQKIFVSGTGYQPRGNNCKLFKTDAKEKEIF